MGKLTDYDHFESAAYMIRNLYTGDDEQTRVEDQQYLDELPSELAAAVTYLCNAGKSEDYDGACLIYIRWHLLQVIRDWYNWDKHKALFIQAANEVYNGLYEWEDMDEEEKQDVEKGRAGIKDWADMVKVILCPGTK